VANSVVDITPDKLEINKTINIPLKTCGLNIISLLVQNK
jgi:hypothetical protein